jgi:hypothetical protein
MAFTIRSEVPARSPRQLLEPRATEIRCHGQCRQVDLGQQTGAPLAVEAVRRIDAIFEIGSEIKSDPKQLPVQGEGGPTPQYVVHGFGDIDMAEQRVGAVRIQLFEIGPSDAMRVVRVASRSFAGNRTTAA